MTAARCSLKSCGLPSCGLLLVLAALSVSPARAQESGDRWTVRADLQGLFNSYENATDRDSLINYGVFMHADYFERAGFTLGYNRTGLRAGPGISDVDQDNYYLSGRFSLTPDAMAGRITVRLDGHAVSNDDVTDGTDEVTAVGAQISFLNFASTFYWDIGYTNSTYGDRTQGPSELEIGQLTPTVGFGFNDRRDWVQLRSYLIDASIPSLALGEDDSAALELKWTHWPLGGGFLGLDNFRIAVLTGERLFAVDPDAGGLYNLSDLQTGSASIGAEWALSDRSRLLILLGSEQYENAPLARSYRSAFIYMNFSHRWE